MNMEVASTLVVQGDERIMLTVQWWKCSQPRFYVNVHSLKYVRPYNKRYVYITPLFLGLEPSFIIFNGSFILL